MREVHSRVRGRGASLRENRDGWTWYVNQLLFPDDITLGRDSERLNKLVNEFGRVCERRKLMVKVVK